MKAARHVPLQPSRALVLLAVAVLLLLPQAAFAKYASLVIDAATGQVLHEDNADDRNYPASLTKMMTLFLVFDALDSGRLSLDQKLMVSPHAAKQPPSNLGLRPGQTIAVRDAILALVTKSANDVAAVIAENMAESEPAFAELMTAKARKLGMTRTIFRNASGLPDDEQMTTARDMATLAMALLREHPKQYAYFSTEYFEYQGNRYRNHNNLLGRYDGIDGIKTGFINASGFNLVASVNRQGRRLIGVVFGGETGRARDNQMVSLLNKGFQSEGGQMMASAAPSPGRRAPAMLISPPPAQSASAKAQAKTRLASAAAPTKSAPSAPSSIGKKVAEIIKEVNPVSSAKAAPVPSDRTPTAATSVDLWGIQVGAYAKPDPAREMAERAIKQAHNVIDDGIVKITPLQMANGRHLYRARIFGLSRDQAYQACQVLERKKMNCMEVHVTDPTQMASTEN